MNANMWPTNRVSSLHSKWTAFARHHSPVRHGIWRTPEVLKCPKRLVHHWRTSWRIWLYLLKGRQLRESTTLKAKPGNSRTVYFSTSHQRLLRKMQTATLIYIGGIGIIPVSKALILERFYILQQLWRHVWGLPPLPLLPRRVLGSSSSPCRSCQGTYDIRWCSCTARNQSLPKIICIFHQESMVPADDNCLANAWTAQKIQYQFQKQDETRASLSQSWKSTHVPDPKSTFF